MSIASLKMPSYNGEPKITTLTWRRAQPNLPMQYFGEIIRAGYRSKSGFSAAANAARARANVRQMANVS